MSRDEGHAILDISDVTAGYGRKLVVHEVGLEIRRGQVTAIIGHNGAGKTTLLNAIFGLIPLRSGQVVFDGHDVSQEGPATKLARGIVFVPQGRNVFGDLKVAEHFELVARSQSRLDANLEKVFELFPDLRAKLGAKASTLSGGQRQMVAIAAGILREPAVLLVDEPSIGLAPILVDRVLGSIEALSAELGLTAVVVEQNVKSVLKISHWVAAMRGGRIIEFARAEDVRAMDLHSLWQLL